MRYVFYKSHTVDRLLMLQFVNLFENAVPRCPMVVPHARVNTIMSCKSIFTNCVVLSTVQALPQSMPMLFFT